MSNFYEQCLHKKETIYNIEHYILFWSKTNKTETLYDFLGLSKIELEFLLKFKEINFIELKRKYPFNTIKNNNYICFAIISDNFARLEFGWVKNIMDSNIEIICDDMYGGIRTCSIESNDIITILPDKEYPLLYYREKKCAECKEYKKCHLSKPIPKKCPHKIFFKSKSFLYKNYDKSAYKTFFP